MRTLPLVKVLVARGPKPGTWTRIHRDPGCSGLRKGELADGASYLELDLDDLPESVKPCQFPCCYQGYATASDLKRRVGTPSRPAEGIRVGQEVEFRKLGGSELMRRRIVRGPADRSKDELSDETPIARAMIGREAGDVADAELPGKTIQIEIVRVT
ncbi:hypothetical protein HJD18_12555 [Thermoleophilia bacterium SCSIO 60948]|nr:hypothetical protein HJD18_12555 [Thermoleophilia bacterium SCSIO 60948]